MELHGRIKSVQSRCACDRSLSWCWVHVVSLWFVWICLSNDLCPADVNIWLVTFGFHLHNAIPGYPIPKFDLTQPSLEMKKSQLWDDLPVRIWSTRRNVQMSHRGQHVSVSSPPRCVSQSVVRDRKCFVVTCSDITITTAWEELFSKISSAAFQCEGQNDVVMNIWARCTKREATKNPTKICKCFTLKEKRN